MYTLSTMTLAVAIAAVTPAALAQSHAPGGHASQGHGGAHDGAAAAVLTDGEVKKIDKDAGKITLRHGEIKNLNMAAMTMVLRVRDPAMLEQVQVGDKVKFAADRLNGAVTIVQMQKTQ